jgi:hypothetical protein
MCSEAGSNGDGAVDAVLKVKELTDLIYEVLGVNWCTCSQCSGDIRERLRKAIGIPDEHWSPYMQQIVEKRTVMDELMNPATVDVKRLDDSSYGLRVEEQ